MIMMFAELIILHSSRYILLITKRSIDIGKEGR